MQREILFRYWDAEYSVWMELSDLMGDYQQNAFRTYGKPFLLCDFFEDMHDENPRNRYNEEQIVIQQFTGLLDKNGAKIFEGDIIRHGCTSQEYESVVAYKAPTFIAKTFSYKKENNWRAEKPKEFDVIWEKKGLAAFNEGWYMGDRSFCGDDYVEVIGNIFENPELLEK